MHIRQELEGSQQYDLIINLSKCQFGRLEIDFLGHYITKQGALTTLQGIHHQGVYQSLDNQGTTEEFIGMVSRSLPRPRQSRELFGMVHFYHCCASSSKLNATSLPIPDSEAHGTMVERGDGNSIQFCKGGTSHSHLPLPRCPTLGQLGNSATLQPYLNRHQHQTSQERTPRPDALSHTIINVPSSMQ